MIPPTRQPKPYRRPNGLPFARGDDWRPLRLVLDDDSLPEADLAVLLSLADEVEIDLTRTRPGRLPWLEPQQPADDHVPIHQHAPAGGTSMFWVWNAASLAERARRIVGQAEIDEHAARPALIFAEASEELENDGFVTAREFLLQQNSPGGPAIYNANEALALIGRLCCVWSACGVLNAMAPTQD